MENNEKKNVFKFLNPFYHAYGVGSQRWHNWWDPNHKEYGMDFRKYKVTGGALVALLILIGLLVALFTFIITRNYDSKYFSSKYKTPLFVPPPSAPLALVTPPKALPTDASINMNIFPTIGDQDGLGSCQAWASVYYQMSYDFRKQHPGWWTRFSPRFSYDEASQGYDQGSYFNTDVNFISAVGVPRFMQYPYGLSTAKVGKVSYSINPYQNPPEYPLPQWAIAAAGQQKYNISVNTLTEYPGAGSSVVTLIKEQLNNGYPVNLGLPVFQGFDNATNTNGYIEDPTPSELINSPNGRGGHAITIVGYHDGWTHTDAFGRSYAGYFVVANQWTQNWGVKGFGYIPYEFVAKYGFSIKVLNLGNRITSAPKAGPTVSWFRPRPLQPHYKPSQYDPNANKILQKPPTAVSANMWYVHNTLLRNGGGYGQDISSIINAAGDRYNVSPVFIAAMIGNESGFNQYASRYNGFYDTSFGLTQVSLATLDQYGICGGNVGCAQGFEYNVYNSVNTGARLLRDFMAYHNFRIGPPNAYILYNAGPGYSDSFYYNPYGQAYTNYQVFLQWWYYSLAHFAAAQGYQPSPYKKTVTLFNLNYYEQYRRVHNLSDVQVYYGKSLGHVAYVWQYGLGSTKPLWSGCGPVRSSEAWNSSNGVMKQRFSKCTVYSWPQTKGDPVKIVKR